MKVIFSLLLITTTNLSFAQGNNSSGGKRVIDSTMFGKWPSVGGAQISNDGYYAIYNIANVPLGGKTLVFQSTFSNWKREFVSASQGQFTEDSKYGIFKLPGDSLCLFELGKDARKYISHVNSYTLSGKWLGYLDSEPSIKNKFVLYNLNTDAEECFEDIIDFSFDPSGHGLLYQTAAGKDSSLMYTLHWLNLNDGTNSVIWKGEKAASSYTFDSTGQKMLFTAANAMCDGTDALWHYRPGIKTARLQITQDTPGIGSKLMIGPGSVVFSKDGKRIFFNLIEKEIPKALPGAINIDVWSYTDKRLQSEQLQYHGFEKESFSAVMAVDGDRVIRLEQGDEKICIWNNRLKENNKYLLIAKGGGLDLWWQKSARPSIYLVSTEDGARKLLKENVPYRYDLAGLDFRLSPDERYVVYYDPKKKHYFSYDIAAEATRNITKGIAVSWNDKTNDNPGLAANYPVGIAGWIAGDIGVLINDNYDIWLIDPSDVKKPLNMTNGYGRLHGIKFRLEGRGDEILQNISPDSPLVMTAFNAKTKLQGFFRKVPTAKGDPELLNMGPHNWGSSSPQKAKDADVWIAKRMSATEAPNYYTSHDLKNWHALSDLHPEKNYNWLSAELINWKLPDGTMSQGILYKPENFDSKKKYPLLLNYYEKKSDGLNNYLEPEASEANINIPYFVSRGYLVFQPDIHYKIGYPGESALNAIISSAKFLGQKPWVDAKRMGIQGHSWGGYETNYVVTHSHLFAAAAEASGPTDYISGYGAIMGFGASAQYFYETGQTRMGKNLWEIPDLYVKSSPVFMADKVTTPLLMMHNKDDGQVPFAQGVELFTGLRRLGKKVWMLQYDGEGHGVQGKNALDYTIRMEQFFDHYLKGAPPPKWMTEGIPARMKGIDTGLDLDLSGKKP